MASRIDQQPKLYVVPGWNNRDARVKTFSREIGRFVAWNEGEVHDVLWRSVTPGQELKTFVGKVRGDLERGKEVRLLGLQEGGLFVVNTLLEVPEVTRVATVASALHDYPGRPKAPYQKKNYCLYDDLLRKFAEQEPDLPTAQRENVLNVVYDSFYGMPLKAGILIGAHLEVPSFNQMNDQNGVELVFEPDMQVAGMNVKSFLNKGTIPYSDKY